MFFAVSVSPAFFSLYTSCASNFADQVFLITKNSHISFFSCFTKLKNTMQSGKQATLYFLPNQLMVALIQRDRISILTSFILGGINLFVISLLEVNSQRLGRTPTNI